MISHRHRGSLGVIVFPCLDRHNTTEKMNLFAVLLCVFLADIQSSQGRTFPVPLPASHTPNGVMLPGWRDGNERSKTDGNTLPVKPRIFNGTEAEKHEFPWVVELQLYNTTQKKYRHQCGASVIDEWWIMTAANCVDLSSLITEISNDLEVRIVAGEHKLSEVEVGEQHREVKNIVIHPGWDNVTLENDIALLKLSEKLELDGKTVAPISLPTSQTNSTGKCVMAGWGRTNYESNTLSDVLKKVTVPIVPDEQCRKKYDILHEKVLDSMICAGYEKGDENAFQVSYFVDWINEVRNQESLQH
ncbi:trypsin-1-like isoform X2 [Portunus trituberculatus]|uniref:trypsin-1-like isoform X2 n=1 Tax=Portunus trituberculatus TaxID=210409 RepID=UPI001E1CD6E5|nr:trypsin-1-like isoform X2 [Portunus trituberculatus]